MSYDHFAGPDLDGEIVGSARALLTELNGAAPDTMGEALLDFACKHARPS